MIAQSTKEHLKLASWIGILLLISYVTGILTKSNIDNWYETLNRSFLTPPGYVFGIVWSILYVMIAIVGWLIWNQKSNPEIKILKYLFISQLILNWAWSPLFFLYHKTGFSIFLLISMIILTALLAFKSYRTLISVSLLMIPYFLWLLFALYLNIYIWLYN
tara:strand:- start:246 stop:728 length:483 start_codon:yes stop_codon:yes gene_type:complete